MNIRISNNYFIWIDILYRNFLSLNCHHYANIGNTCKHTFRGQKSSGSIIVQTAFANVNSCMFSLNI